MVKTKLFFWKVLVVSFLIYGLFIQTITLSGANANFIEYGVTKGDKFIYQFIDNNTKGKVSIGISDEFIVQNQDNITIVVTSFNSSDIISAVITAQVNNETPFGLCLCEPYFISTKVLEQVITNGSLANYGNVTFFDNTTVVLRMVDYQVHNIWEESYQRNTGVLNYWIKYHVFENESVVFTGFKLISQSNQDFTLIKDFSPESSSSSTPKSSIANYSTSGFEVVSLYVYGISIIVVRMIKQRKIK